MLSTRFRAKANDEKSPRRKAELGNWLIAMAVSEAAALFRRAARRRINAMCEKRIFPRRRSLKSGLIIINDNAPKIAVRNVSNTGAALQVSTSMHSAKL
jgi:hypothetical protein